MDSQIEIGFFFRFASCDSFSLQTYDTRKKRPNEADLMERRSVSEQNTYKYLILKPLDI